MLDSYLEKKRLFPEAHRTWISKVGVFQNQYQARQDAGQRFMCLFFLRPWMLSLIWGKASWKIKILWLMEELCNAAFDHPHLRDKNFDFGRRWLVNRNSRNPSLTLVPKKTASMNWEAIERPAERHLPAEKWRCSTSGRKWTFFTKNWDSILFSIAELSLGLLIWPNLHVSGLPRKHAKKKMQMGRLFGVITKGLGMREMEN